MDFFNNNSAAMIGEFQVILRDSPVSEDAIFEDRQPLSSALPLPSPSELGYVKPGDVLRVNPAGGEIRVLYRHASPHNVLFITERCNSRCLMCSQPPREVDDRHHLDDILRVIPLMDLAERDAGRPAGQHRQRREFEADLGGGQRLHGWRARCREGAFYSR